MDVVDAWNFERFEFKMSFGWRAYAATSHKHESQTLQISKCIVWFQSFLIIYEFDKLLSSNKTENKDYSTLFDVKFKQKPESSSFLISWSLLWMVPGRFYKNSQKLLFNRTLSRLVKMQVSVIVGVPLLTGEWSVGGLDRYGPQRYWGSPLETSSRW